MNCFKRWSQRVNKLQTLKNLFLICFLPFLFTTASCLKTEPCDLRECDNDGYCNDGSCVCPEGYSGTYCETEVLPTSVEITNIRITEFSISNRFGVPYDSASGPDIFISIYGNNGLSYNHPANFENASPTFQYNFVPNVPIVFNKPDYNCDIILKDLDAGNTFDVMGLLSFQAYNPNGNFPEKLSIEDDQRGVKIEVSLSYIF